MKKLLLTLAIALAAVLPSMADSPLTSTNFVEAYEDDANVKMAAESNYFGGHILGVLCGETYATIGVRLAIVNQFGWNFDGQDHAQIMASYLNEMYGWKSEKDIIKKADAHTLITYAYVKAMDDYFDVKAAKKIADAALKKAPKSRAVNMIHAVINAQYTFNAGKWNKIFPEANKAATDPNLENDFSAAAVDLIMEYIGLYEIN